MRAVFGWALFVLGIMMLVCFTWIGVLIAHLIPVALAGLVIYAGLRFLSDA